MLSHGIWCLRLVASFIHMVNEWRFYKLTVYTIHVECDDVMLCRHLGLNAECDFTYAINGILVVNVGYNLLSITNYSYWNISSSENVMLTLSPSLSGNWWKLNYKSKVLKTMAYPKASKISFGRGKAYLSNYVHLFLGW